MKDFINEYGEIIVLTIAGMFIVNAFYALFQYFLQMI